MTSKTMLLERVERLRQLVAGMTDEQADKLTKDERVILLFDGLLAGMRAGQLGPKLTVKTILDHVSRLLG